ncbi:MAG: YkgJ family cysteine cluster protein [Clostridiales bacterium]|nr:YkgJ family cysteine cluster protein [Clostridiales bacterium]MCF8022510.1 YkgJ family cysteine cluster protein [Clostridiales bacterium]
MINNNLFEQYKGLVVEADNKFDEVCKDNSALVKCGPGCADCCYSVFGVFLIEAVFIKHHFDKLDRKYRREAYSRSLKYDKKLQDIEKKLQVYNNNLTLKADIMGRKRIRCPLLNDQNLCILYPYRPVTCRVYGIPTVINGETHSCWKSAFKKDQSYEAYDMDSLYKKLYSMSKKLLEIKGQKNMEHASHLISISKVINTPVDELINK